MNYQTTLSGLDWSMMPSGATVPPSGIAVMTSYENQLGKIVAGNGGGEKVIDLSSSNYTGSIDDTLYDYIVLSGSINSARTVSLYHDNMTQLGSKRYFLCASKQLKSTGESYNITVNSTTGGSAIYIVTTTSGFSSDTLIPIYVDNLGNVVEQSKTVPITINTSSIISYAMAAIGAGICEFGQNSNGYYFKIKLGTGTGILVCFAQKTFSSPGTTEALGGAWGGWNYTVSPPAPFSALLCQTCTHNNTAGGYTRFSGYFNGTNFNIANDWGDSFRASVFSFLWIGFYTE